MIFKCRCGHEETKGFWKDDDWMFLNELCTDCKRKRRSSVRTVEFVHIKTGSRTLTVKRKGVRHGRV